jgi:hypothetical protein
MDLLDPFGLFFGCRFGMFWPFEPPAFGITGPLFTTSPQLGPGLCIFLMAWDHHSRVADQNCFWWLIEAFPTIDIIRVYYIHIKNYPKFIYIYISDHHHHHHHHIPNCAPVRRAWTSSKYLGSVHGGVLRAWPLRLKKVESCFLMAGYLLRW